MNSEIIKSEKIKRDILDLDSIVIDELKEKPTKIDKEPKETDISEQILQNTVIEETNKLKYKKIIQENKKELCCCNCGNCYNNKKNYNEDDIECCNYLFWHWCFSNTNNDNLDNNCECCKIEDMNCDCVCDCDFDD